MSPGTTRYAILYGLAAGSFLAVTGFRNLLLPPLSLRASRTLFRNMSATVMAAPMGWFEATPLGRALNRFSSDIAAIDTDVANQFKDTIVISLNVCAITLVCCFGSGQLVASAVVFGAVVLTLVFSYRVYALYRTAAREQKRLESVSKSPLLAFFAEAVQGAGVVRAFGQASRFVEEGARKVPQSAKKNDMKK